jgi:hypothetical protein
LWSRRAIESLRTFTSSQWMTWSSRTRERLSAFRLFEACSAWPSLIATSCTEIRRGRGARVAAVDVGAPGIVIAVAIAAPGRVVREVMFADGRELCDRCDPCFVPTILLPDVIEPCG